MNIFAIDELPLPMLLGSKGWINGTIYAVLLLCHLPIELWMLFGWVVFWKRRFVGLIGRFKRI